MRTRSIPPTYDGEESEPIVSPARSQPAGQRRGRDRGRHGDLHPAHNAGEVCAAAMHLIAYPDCSTADLLVHMPGPDFPTRHRCQRIRPRCCPLPDRRGGFRLRAKWEWNREATGGTGRSSSRRSPISAKVQADRAGRAVDGGQETPLLGDIRDESSDIIRLRAGTENPRVEPEVLMETVFAPPRWKPAFHEHERAGRHPHAAGDVVEGVRAPGSITARGAGAPLQSRLAAIDRRIEVLEGYLLVYLNLDE